MTNLKDLFQLEITYIVNGLGEKLTNVSKELYDKYCQVDSHSKFLNYLVEHEEGSHYVYSCLEFMSNDKYGNDIVEFSKVQEIAQEIESLTCFDVYTGKHYGFDECHEIGILIPIDTDETVVKQEFEKLNPLAV